MLVCPVDGAFFKNERIELIPGFATVSYLVMTSSAQDDDIRFVHLKTGKPGKLHSMMGFKVFVFFAPLAHFLFNLAFFGKFIPLGITIGSKYKGDEDSGREENTDY